MENKDLYKILQVDPSAESEVISVAYRRLALKYHPDTNPYPDAVRRMQEINEAYQVLGDTSKRIAYDLLRQRLLDAAEHEQTGKSLMYRSSFDSTDPYWKEHSEWGQKTFIKDGYFHLSVSSHEYHLDDGSHFISHFLPLDLPKNFKAYYEAQLSEDSDVECEYGMFFYYKKHGNQFSYYRFGIVIDRFSDELPQFNLVMLRDGELKDLVEYRRTRLINSRKYTIDSSNLKIIVERSTGWTKNNRFLVDVKDDQISLGANGKILVRTANQILREGSIGFYVGVLKNSFADVRIQNVRLYSK